MALLTPWHVPIKYYRTYSGEASPYFPLFFGGEACSAIYYKKIRRMGRRASQTRKASRHERIVDAERKRRKELLEELAALGRNAARLFVITGFRGCPQRRYEGAARTIRCCTRSKKKENRLAPVNAPDLVPRHQEQIGAFRRFEAISAELVRIGEKISDLVLSDEEELKKKRSRRGKK